MLDSQDSGVRGPGSQVSKTLGFLTAQFWNCRMNGVIGPILYG